MAQCRRAPRLPDPPVDEPDPESPRSWRLQAAPSSLSFLWTAHAHDAGLRD